MSGELESLQAELFGKDEVIAELQGRQGKQERQIGQLEQRLRELSEELGAVEAEAQGLRGEVAQMNGARQEAEGRATEAERQLKAARQEQQLSKEQCSDALAKLKASLQAAQRHRASEQQLQAALAELQQETEELRETKGQLQRTVESAKQENEELNALYRQQQGDALSHHSETPAGETISVRDELRGLSYDFFTPVPDRRSMDLPPHAFPSPSTTTLRIGDAPSLSLPSGLKSGVTPNSTSSSSASGRRRSAARRTLDAYQASATPRSPEEVEGVVLRARVEQLELELASAQQEAAGLRARMIMRSSPDGGCPVDQQLDGVVVPNQHSHCCACVIS